MVDRSVKELKLMARELKIKNYYKMSKSELIDSLIQAEDVKNKVLMQEIFHEIPPEEIVEEELVRIKGISGDLEVGKVVKKMTSGVRVLIKTGVKRNSRVKVAFADVGSRVEEELAKENIIKRIEERVLIPYLDPALKVRLAERETLFLTRISKMVKGYHLGRGIYKISGKSVNYYARTV